MIEHSTCPTDEVLEDYVLNNCSDRQWLEITNHLEQCESCASRISETEDYLDALIGALEVLEREPRGNEGRLLATAASVS